MFFVAIILQVLVVWGAGVCGPLYTDNCAQFTSSTSCTCAPGSTEQSCARASELQYFTFNAATQTFMYCQWQFDPFASANQCGRGSECTPSNVPDLQVCRSNLQARTVDTTNLQATIDQLQQQLANAKAEATRMQWQLDQQRIDNQELRIELAKGGIFTVDLQTDIQTNFTRDILLDATLNQTLQDALENVTYYQRLVCGPHQGCCPYSAAVSSAPLLVVIVGLFICA